MAKGRIARVKTVLVTGSSGLICSEAVEHFDRQGYHVIGVDNNMRRMFFGPPGDTTWILERLKSVPSNFLHANIDIRDRVLLRRFSAAIVSISSCMVRLSRRTTRREISRL